MKKLILLLMFLPAAFWSCSNDDDDDKKGVDPSKLITPEFASVSLSSQSPFSGILMVAPAQGDGSIYYGNYNTAGKLSPMHALYTLTTGTIVHSNIPLRLPAGAYNLVYWGVPVNTAADSTYSLVAANEPAYIIGNDMKQMKYTLRPYSKPDTTYYPVFDYVHSVEPLQVGTEKMSTVLTRVTAGLRVTLQDKDGGALNPVIAGARIQVGSIASTLNYYTAEASDFTKTISFPLDKSADGTRMSANSTVMLFPSGPNPELTILLTLTDGKTKVYRQPLDNTLSAGTRLTLTASIGEIFVEETTSNGFEVTNWKEISENINIPSI